MLENIVSIGLTTMCGVFALLVLFNGLGEQCQLKNNNGWINTTLIMPQQSIIENNTEKESNN